MPETFTHAKITPTFISVKAFRSDLIPATICHNSPNGTSVHFENSSNCYLLEPSSSPHLSYFNNLIPVELGASVGHPAARSPRSKVGALFKHIPVVVRTRTEPKVFWINASPIVSSGAVVKNPHPIRNRPKMDHPTGSVTAHLPRVFRTIGSAPVTSRVHIPSPKPAAFSLVNMFPKTLNEGDAAPTGGENLIGVNRNDLPESLDVNNVRSSIVVHSKNSFVVPRSRLLHTVREQIHFAQDHDKHKVIPCHLT